MDMGDHVIVINARKAVLKGAKVDQKVYRHHTLYPGGLREVSARDMLAKRPERVIELAIKGMLPKNKLGKAMAKKLKVYRRRRAPAHGPAPATPRTHSTIKSTITKQSRIRGRDNCG